MKLSQFDDFLLVGGILLALQNGHTFQLISICLGNVK